MVGKKAEVTPMKKALILFSALWLFGCASTSLAPQHLYLAGDSTLAEKLPKSARKPAGEKSCNRPSSRNCRW